MSQFANEFTKNEIFDQPGRIFRWRTLIEIIIKSKAYEEML